MSESVTELMDRLINHYESKFGETREFNEYAIKQIFFYDDPIVSRRDYNEIQSLHPGYTIETGGDGKYYVDLTEFLDDVEKQEINIIKETFSATVSDGMIIANHGAFNPDEPEYRKNYWPTIYNIDVFKEMIAELHKGFVDKFNLINDR